MATYFRNFPAWQMFYNENELHSTETLQKMFDEDPNSSAAFYFRNLPSASKRVFLILYMNIPSDLRFYGIKLNWTFNSEYGVVSPTVGIIKNYPPTIPDGGWGDDVYFLTSIPFISAPGSSFSNTLLSSGQISLLFRDGFSAYLGDTTIPSGHYLVPSSYNLINKKNLATGGGTLYVAFSYTSSANNIMISLFVRDIALVIPEDTGNWFYVGQGTTTPTEITSTLTNNNLSDFVTGLNNTDKVLLGVFPRTTSLNKLSLYLQSETGSPLTLKVFGDTEFDFSGQPITTIEAPASPAWVTLYNLVVPTVVQIVP